MIDAHTGLPNFRAAMGTLRQGAALAVVDLVHFSDRVNGPHGRLVGDQVLASVAHRLAQGLAPWRVFRSAGDEFTVEVIGPLDRLGAERLAERVADLLADRFEEIGPGSMRKLASRSGVSRATHSRSISRPYEPRTSRPPVAACPSSSSVTFPDERSN